MESTSISETVLKALFPLVESGGDIGNANHLKKKPPTTHQLDGLLVGFFLSG